MEYRISKIEINRRKKAYTTLSISILVGLVVSSIAINSPITIIGYLLVLATLCSLGLFSFRFLRHLSSAKITLSDKTLKRVINGISEEFSLHKINRIKIKWTTNNTIRGIYFWSDDEKKVVISAIDEFEVFKENLLKKLHKNIIVEEIHEPLDFDHPLFYSLLGLPIGTAGILILKFIPLLRYQHIKIVEIVFFIYLLILGIYFLISKPLSKELGSKKTGSDFIIGGLMICSGIIILLLSLN